MGIIYTRKINVKGVGKISTFAIKKPFKQAFIWADRT